MAASVMRLAYESAWPIALRAEFRQSFVAGKVSMPPSMKIGFRPRVKLFQTQLASPPSPQMWSVSVTITLAPVAAGGFVS